MKQYTDLTYLQELTDNDEELIIQSLKRYFNSSSSQLQSLLKSTDEQDWEGIHNSAHSLFATTQIVGITDLAKALKDIQLLAREKRDFDQIEQDVKQANEIINHSYQEIQAHLDKLQNSQ
ncbi:hypothetical protein C900_04683 [Fulvivirga imtechensis AK7]|uniref:HPt domain-containing protein n=1 Tax=Fulvivirga imtechensis AK7 TaxID=1237149 RepID=L8JL93_9BACT|nr:Hpt domain-containing protein [Fulvivirga imtechensis]ELR69706.1 hypothetical protein C900_04683 [Fulvivirga imtechensis AK7]